MSGCVPTTSRSAAVRSAHPGTVVEQPGNFQEQRYVDCRRTEQRSDTPGAFRNRRVACRRIGQSDSHSRRQRCSGADTRIGAAREYGSSSSQSAITRSTASASSTVRANIEMVSSERHAGTTPRADTLPSVGFNPTILPNAAGTRPDPAVSVPSREVHDAGRHRAGRAGRRSARHICRIEAIARHAVRTACADKAGGKLIQIGLADQQRALRPANAAPQGAVCRRGVGVAGTASRRRQAGDVDVVLDRKRHAPELASARSLPLELTGARQYIVIRAGE